jgi:hypothetical protein
VVTTASTVATTACATICAPTRQRAQPTSVISGEGTSRNEPAAARPTACLMNHQSSQMTRVANLPRADSRSLA